MTKARKQPTKKLPELTFDEFTKLPLLYSLGMRFDWGAHRQYRNDEHGFCVEVVTKQMVRGDIYSGWKPEQRTYFLDGDDREFKTVDQLYVAYMEKACGVAA